MADVVVTVMIDGKQAFVAGAAGAPDATLAATMGLQHGLAHFQGIINTVRPAEPATKPKDTSL